MEMLKILIVFSITDTSNNLDLNSCFKQYVICVLSVVCSVHLLKKLSEPKNKNGANKIIIFWQKRHHSASFWTSHFDPSKH